MRFLSILLAIAVGAVLYLWVLEREWLYGSLGMAAAPPAAEVELAEPVAAETPQNDLIRVLALKSKAQMVDRAVILRGQTEASREVAVNAETSSTVVSEPLRKGTFVSAGQELCMLDPGTRAARLASARARLIEAQARRIEAQGRAPETRARVLEAEALLEEALVNENAAVKLSEGGYASDTRVKNARAGVAAARAGVEAAKSGLGTTEAGIQSAEAGVEAAAAEIAAAEKEIDRLAMHAPFAGLLESDTAELGSLLQPGGLCATIIQLDPIKLVAFVPETELGRIELGAPVKGRIAGADSADIMGKVSFLSRSADPNTRTFRVEVEIPNPDLTLRDGQTVEMQIAAPGEMAHLLPASAMTLNDHGELGLRLVDDEGIVTFQPVGLIRDTRDGVWLSGLPAQANVIIVGQEYVTEGVKVAPSFEAPS